MAGKYAKKSRHSALRVLIPLLMVLILAVGAVCLGPRLLARLRAQDTEMPSDPPTQSEPTEHPSDPTELSTQSPTEDTLPPSTEPEPAPWNLVLVNAAHALPEDWEIELTNLRYGQQVDSRMYPELQRMFDDCRADGLLPMVLSSYRSHEDQARIFEGYKQDYLDQGYSEEAAEAAAGTWAALPGTSEHQLGLAVDIDSDDLTRCTNEAVWSWMAQHCAEYGFILRYPEGKEDITGISHEPWHFRYVGREAATEIMEQGITLEEYLGEA